MSQDAHKMPTLKLNREILLAAIDGFEFQKLRIDAQITEIERLLNDGEPESKAAPVDKTAPVRKARKKKRKLSAEGRAAIVAALKKRWAAKKAEQAQPV